MGPLTARREQWRSVTVIVAMTVVGLVLATEIARRAIAHRFEDDRPAAALKWDANDPAALVARANALIGPMLSGAARGPTPGDDVQGASPLARQALAGAPLGGEALRDLSILARARGHETTADALLKRSARFGYRDTATQAMLLQSALKNNDFPGAMLRMDAILRVQPTFKTSLFPLMGAILNQPGGAQAIASTLAPHPAWRSDALAALADREADTAPVIRLSAELQRRGSPANASEQEVFLTRLVRDEQFAPALAMWRASLGAGAAPELAPYDEAFRGLPGSPPFNWRLNHEPGVVAELSGGALHIEYSSRASVTLARQLVVLGPGQHRLTGVYAIDEGASGAALNWSIQCATPTGAVLAQTRQPAQAQRDWSPIAAGFNVPADCPAQWLALTGIAGDGFGDVAARFGHLGISAATAAQPASGAARSRAPS